MHMCVSFDSHQEGKHNSTRQPSREASTTAHDSHQEKQAQQHTTAIKRSKPNSHEEKRAQQPSREASTTAHNSHQEKRAHSTRQPCDQTLKACMSETRERLCILALTLAASSEVPSLASTPCCSHIMSSVMGACSWGEGDITPKQNGTKKGKGMTEG